MSCNYVYNDYISCGVEDIVLEAGLTPGQEKDVIISTPNNSKYKNTLEVDAFGNLTIPVNSFPDGFFNPYSGPWTLHIDGGCDDVLFCDYFKYIQFEAVNGNQEKNTLSCCTPGGDSPTSQCCVTTVIPFVNEAVTVVPYTGTRPTIEVAYDNGDGTWTLEGISTTVTFDANEFTIDHGGIASGLIKLLK